MTQVTFPLDTCCFYLPCLEDFGSQVQADRDVFWDPGEPASPCEAARAGSGRTQSDRAMSRLAA